MQIDTTINQIKELVENPQLNRVLVTSGTNVDPDALGSALALASALEVNGKQVTVAIEDFDNTRMAFMPGIDRVSGTVAQKSLVISIEVGQHPIEKINYNAQDTRFNLVLTPPAGAQVSPDQISYTYTGLDYDLIFVVDTASRKLLGKWAVNFTEELKAIPVINLDHHADNDHFGTLNLVMADQPSASLVVEQLIRGLGWTSTPDQATNLLAGLLSDTAGFVNRNTTADSLRAAADLIDQGADLPGTMKHLFRTMSVAALNLWSRVLGRVQVINNDIVITHVSLADLAETGATQTDEDTLGSLINGFIPAVPGAKVGIVLKEKEDGQVKGSLRSIDPSVNVQAMAKQLNGGGHILASGFKLTDTTLDQAQLRVIQVVTQSLAQDATVDTQNTLPPQEESPTSSQNQPQQN